VQNAQKTKALKNLVRTFWRETALVGADIAFYRPNSNRQSCGFTLFVFSPAMVVGQVATAGNQSLMGTETEVTRRA
jgi:hypothetical protein